jgi:hypothetical protein
MREGRPHASDISQLPSQARPRLLDQVRQRLRVLHYRIRTEDAYVNWIKRFILFHNKRHPLEMGEADLEAFLTHLAVEGRVAVSTRNQALAAILFLHTTMIYTHVLQSGPSGVRSPLDRL